MGDQSDPSSTRRRFVRTGVGLAVGGAFAGCSSSSEPSDSQATATDEAASGRSAATDTETTTDEPAASPRSTETEASTATETAVSTPETPYTATLAPAGEVTFESEPESVFTVMGHHAEMALLLGRGEDVNATYAPSYVDSLVNTFTARLDGVSVDWADLTTSWNPGRETVYELDSDIHLGDPARVVTMGNWDQSAIEKVAESVGPWFGNSYSANHAEPPKQYADAYEYYTLWEIFERVAAAFREGRRFEALASIHDDLVSTVESNRPPADERPSVAMVLPSTSEDGVMWAYRINAEGYYAAHTRPLGATDAMAEAGVQTGAKIDYETLAEANPEVLIVLGGVVDWHDMAGIRQKLADDPVASTVTAVEEGRVYAQGTRHQGPLVNLFQLEMGAKQLYPEQFGEWPTYESGPYPALSADEQLFDRDRLAGIVTRGR